jgi:mycoredoxin
MGAAREQHDAQLSGTHDEEPMTAQSLPAPGTITMYSTTWCGYCRRLKTQLDSEGIGYTEIDIEDVPDAAALVASLNGGNQTVPTVVFPDGTAATNPSLLEVKQRVSA